MSIETVDLSGGRNLQAGWISTRKRLLGIATYYIGMLLEHLSTIAGVVVGTGNGTGTASADATVPIGAYVLTFTAALVADLTGPDGEVLAQGLTLADGTETVFKIGGMTLSVTDGGTAFVATDTMTFTLVAGELVPFVGGALAGVYNGEDARILASKGTADIIVAGEISQAGIVDGSGDALVLTDDQIEAFRVAGFYFKEV